MFINKNVQAAENVKKKGVEVEVQPDALTDKKAELKNINLSQKNTKNTLKVKKTFKEDTNFLSPNYSAKESKRSSLNNSYISADR